MHHDWQDEIHIYSEAVSSAESTFLQAINHFTWKKMINPRMLSGHLQGRFLSSLVALKKPTCVLEIGTFTGYATACLLENLHSTATLHSIEADPETAHKTHTFWQAHNPNHTVKWHVGKALDVVPTLNINPEIIFVDADKHNYRAYLDLCFPLLPIGGSILFDNTLWSKRVVNEQDRITDRDTQNMHEFNIYANQVKDAITVLLPIRDGITIITKLN